MVDLDTLTKRYYSIGEVADMFEETTSVIRYWENNVPGLNAYKDARGARRFTKEHIEKIKKLHYLIKEEGYTLEGAIHALDSQEEKLEMRLDIEKKLKEVRSFLENFIQRLNKKSPD